MKNENNTLSKNGTKSLTTCAILIAASFVLNELIPHIHMPSGGSITLLSMLPATLCGYFCGPLWGIISCFARGLLDMVLDLHALHPIQIILDYILGFGVLGLSGLFWKKKNGLRIGYAVAVLCRWICSSISGFIFFSETFPINWNPILYSFGYNFLYIGIEGIVTLIVISLPPIKKALENLKKNF